MIVSASLARFHSSSQERRVSAAEAPRVRVRDGRDRTAYAFTTEADRHAALDYLFAWYGAGQRWAPWTEKDRPAIDVGRAGRGQQIPRTIPGRGGRVMSEQQQQTYTEDQVSRAANDGADLYRRSQGRQSKILVLRRSSSLPHCGHG